jgi:hypothetical protein
VKLVAIILLVFVLPVSADVSIGPSVGIRIKTDAAGFGQDIQRSNGIFYGQSWKNFAIALELNETRQESGAGSVRVNFIEREVSLSARKILLSRYWAPFVSGGLILTLPKVETHLSGQVTTSDGESSKLLGIGAGVQSLGSQNLNLDLEIRVVKSVSGQNQVIRLDHLTRLIFNF